MVDFLRMHAHRIHACINACIHTYILNVSYCSSQPSEISQYLFVCVRAFTSSLKPEYVYMLGDHFVILTRASTFTRMFKISPSLKPVAWWQAIWHHLDSIMWDTKLSFLLWSCRTRELSRIFTRPLASEDSVRYHWYATVSDQKLASSPHIGPGLCTHFPWNVHKFAANSRAELKLLSIASILSVSIDAAHVSEAAAALSASHGHAFVPLSHFCLTSSTLLVVCGLAERELARTSSTWQTRRISKSPFPFTFENGTLQDLFAVAFQKNFPLACQLLDIGACSLPDLLFGRFWA